MWSFLTALLVDACQHVLAWCCTLLSITAEHDITPLGAAWLLLPGAVQDDFCDNMYSLANLIEATHICSYMCALSGTNPETSGDWCLLWPEEGFKQQQSGATYCMSGFSFISEQDFPTSPTFPSRKDPQWLRQQVMRKGARHVAKTPKDNGAVRGK